MPKSGGKGDAFNAPGVSWQFQEQARQRAQALAAAARMKNTDEEREILDLVKGCKNDVSIKRIAPEVQKALTRARKGETRFVTEPEQRRCDGCLHTNGTHLFLCGTPVR